MDRQEVTYRILDEYGIEPDHPFPGDGDSCVFRHGDNRKWFALLMNIPYRRVGIAREGNVDILNLKCDPLLAGSMRGKPGFRPAYHMNKERWITALLDGSTERGDIELLLELSYEATRSAKNRRGG